MSSPELVETSSIGATCWWPRALARGIKIKQYLVPCDDQFKRDEISWHETHENLFDRQNTLYVIPKPFRNIDISLNNSVMSKSMDRKKETKKAPKKSLKEKRAEKRAKKG